MERWNADERRWEKPGENEAKTLQQRAKRLRMARTLLQGAQNETSRTLALRLCKRWGLTAIEIGA